MGNKITLTYENGEFNVAINESIVYLECQNHGRCDNFSLQHA